MDVFKNTKIFKKFILIVLIVIAFNVIAPKPVKAGDGLEGAISKFIFWIERGIIRVSNNVFCDSRHAYQYIADEEGSAIVYISPESIIKGKFAILNANIFEDITDPYVDASNPEKDEYYDTYYSGESTDGEWTGIGNEAEEAADKATGYMIKGRTELRNTVAGWYYALRNLAIVALLSILVYVGIRMVISTMSQDKAKYKTMIKDWLVALCLLMTMHYIMVGALNITSMITDAIGTTGRNTGVIQSIMNRIQSINNSEEPDHQVELTSEGLKLEESADPDAETELYTIGDAFAYELVLLGIIGYTLIFAVKYLMRMMTIVFLVLVAPITAITYPIDKISDGKAQAFNTWLQEFIYQVIIQPFHLLIYIVLVGSATTLADTNWLYSIMCFAVMIPSEKFIKQMFGFKDKLSSPLGAFAGGAIASQLASKVLSKDGSSGGNKEKETSTKDENDTTLRESKNKPEMPGADQGTGTPTSYERSQNNNSDSENNNNENNRLEHNNNELGDGQDGVDVSEDNNSELDGEENEQQAVDDQVHEHELAEGEDGDPEELEDGQVKEKELDDGEESEDSDSDENTGIYDPDAESEAVDSGTSSSKNSKLKNAAYAMEEYHNKKLAAKYGTTNKWKAAGKYMGRKALSGGKRVIKGATTLAGGLAGVAIGTMFGKGKAGMAAGAALGNKVGSGINNLGSKAYKRVSPYVKEAKYALKDEDTRRKESLDKIKNTVKERDSASIDFSKRNDGRVATPEELEQELDERARFRADGLTDSQISDAMKVYHEEGGDEEAYRMAYATMKRAAINSASDFEDSAKVQKMLDSTKRQYAEAGVNEYVADEMARRIISNAAGVHGTTAAFEGPSLKEEFMTNSENRAMAAESYKARNKNAEPTQQQIDQELEVGYDLRKQNVSESQIKDFYTNYLNNSDARTEAQNTVGDSADEQVITTEVARRFQIKAKINQPNISESDLTSHINNATQFVKDNNHVSAPTTNQVAREVRHQIEVKDSYNVSGDEINKIRRSEEAFARSSNDKTGARAVIAQQRKNAKAEIAKETTPRGKARAATRETVKAQYQREILGKHSSKEMQDNNVMDKVYEELNTKLENAGLNVSAERGQIAEGIINTSRGMAGIKGEYKYISDRGNVT